MGGDDQIFGANFTSEGVKTLRERVNEKLKELMGDYTDDTLVEYVIVLLKNGRRKDEAKSELNVFLGDDDSDSFVTWLWDHLGSSLSLYVQQGEPHQERAPATIPAAGEPDGKTELHQVESASEKVNSEKKVGRDHYMELKGLVKNADENEAVAEVGKPRDDYQKGDVRFKRSVSPLSTSQNKRMRPEEREYRKREGSQTTASAPRRLLQFALRDVTATSRPSNTSAEPSPKRIRSVVSTKLEDSFLGERPHRIRPVAGMRTAMSAAIKAAAEAVKDVSNVRPSRNVFERLGRATIVSGPTNHQEDYRGVSEDGVHGDYNKRENAHFSDHQRNNSNKRKDRNRPSYHRDTITDSDIGDDGEGYGGANLMGQGATDIAQAGISSGDWVEDPIAGDLDKRVISEHKHLDQAATFSTSVRFTSSVSINNQKNSQYQKGRELSEVDGKTLIQGSDTVGTKSVLRLMEKIKDRIEVPYGNAKRQLAPQDEPQKGTSAASYATGPPTEDADLRTIFINNVHFAATNDVLTRHFNKFGEVLKVVILTDSATGQPKGSAYVEFMNKEAAEHALSLDGTSFMSRILKVVRKGSAQPEAASVMAWPRVTRASPFSVSRFGRAPFGRGIPGLYRSRMPVKPGARSFQWKRETQPTVSDASTQTTHSLTYVRSRTEPKTKAMTNGSSGIA